MFWRGLENTPFARVIEKTIEENGGGVRQIVGTYVG